MKCGGSLKRAYDDCIVERGSAYMSPTNGDARRTYRFELPHDSTSDLLLIGSR
jgi:hypothetical protein